MLKAIKKHLKPYKWLHHMISNKKLHADELWNSRLSFSQFGEDLVLESLFELRGINKGFYVEVGAFDPLLLSNTYFFYKKGWRGICIEPNPISIEKMKSRRPGDIHLNLAVSNHPGKAQFLCDEAKSGILDESYIFKSQSGKECITVATQPLRLVLDQHLPQGQSISFMSVDCEGHDLIVLESNDWETHRPFVVLVEEHSEGKDKSIQNFLSAKQYEFYSRAGVTAFYIDKRETEPTI